MPLVTVLPTLRSSSCRWRYVQPRVLAVAVLAVWVCGACVSTGQVPDRGTLDADIRARTSQGIRVEGVAPMPPDVTVDDGLTAEEAVAIALWNSPSFQATLVDLGVASADQI